MIVTKGWKKESARHALAAKGLKTRKSRQGQTIVKFGKLDWGIRRYLNIINSNPGLRTTDSCSGLHPGNVGANVRIKFESKELCDKWKNKLVYKFNVRYNPAWSTSAIWLEPLEGQSAKDFWTQIGRSF
jgi:tRNA(Phe) wybutosine-synthesizing methylase Tyw3